MIFGKTYNFQALYIILFGIFTTSIVFIPSVIVECEESMVTINYISKLTLLRYTHITFLAI